MMKSAASRIAAWLGGATLALSLAGCGGGSVGFFVDDFDDGSVYLDPVSQGWLGTWTGTLTLQEATQSPSCPTPAMAGGPAQTVTVTANRDATLRVAFGGGPVFDTTPWAGGAPHEPGDLALASTLADGSNASWHLRKRTTNSVDMTYTQFTPVGGTSTVCMQRWAGTLNRLP